MSVNGTWYRHDRRLELTNCTGTCRLRGGGGGRGLHPYTLTNAQCRNAASVATATDNTRSRRAEGRNGRVGAGCNCCTGSANVTDRRRALRNLRVGAGAGEG